MNLGSLKGFRAIAMQVLWMAVLNSWRTQLFSREAGRPAWSEGANWCMDSVDEMIRDTVKATDQSHQKEMGGMLDCTSKKSLSV